MPENRRKMRRLLLSEDDYWRLVAAAKQAGLIPSSTNTRRDVAKLGAEAIVSESMVAIEYHAEVLGIENKDREKQQEKIKADIRMGELYTERFHGDLTGYEGDEEKNER